MQEKECIGSCEKHAALQVPESTSDQISEFFTGLFSTDNWPERWHCGKWSAFEGWLYITADLLIWSAYFTIPFLLVSFIIRKKDVPFPKVFWLFGTFIIACGLTHLIDALAFWWPAYRFNGLVRVITAVASWGTIIALTRILPHAFSLKTPAELERVVNERTEELTKAIEYSRFLADIMPQMVWTAEPNGSTNYFSRQWEKYTGYSAADLIRLRWEMVHPDEREENLALWNRSINDIKPFEFSHRIRRHDGTYRWHLTRAIPQTDKEGNILMWVGTTTDIEDQKEIEKQKDQFMGVASHELKTPLTTVKAYLQLLNKEVAQTKCSDSIKIYLSKANLYTERLEHLISDLLDVSKIQAGKLVINKEIFDLAQLIYECVESDQMISTQHHLKLIKADEPVLVNADKIRIEQTIHNFISNAIKYSPAADTVEVKLEVKEGNAIVSIKDHGIGIQEENIGRVFERFYRIAPTSTKFAGLGIGLFISKEIILQHDGKVWVKSEPGKGSTFYFCLPLVSM